MMTVTVAVVVGNVAVVVGDVGDLAVVDGDCCCCCLFVTVLFV